ncbi:hypothetical protein CS0771_33100 [Catellatospora sp. IY07-71]|uniref:hypothetical protein n=1 Tax=Catellatospora sp. IY07-71 TaxID=2728827 RepID=UPI001BB33346|nr:hypothetical protein [Catellatospora sp. IY07-71]BCJ73766.1 hypothetical protein CS0771_33100 [Catellatospora sp. IY07-71]
MEGFWCFVFVAGTIGALVWQFIETRGAVATTTVVTSYAPDDAARIVQGAFGGPRAVFWTTAGGPGTINMRRRGVRGGITMSIDIRPRPGGGSQVDMWASETAIYLGVLVNFAGVVNRRKRAIARLLDTSASPAVR